MYLHICRRFRNFNKNHVIEKHFIFRVPHKKGDTKKSHMEKPQCPTED